jgi:hypothetical protein
MPTSNTTIYADGEAIPQHTVTVNLDSGVSSITFTDPDQNTQTVNTNGGTVNLTEGIEYTITAITATGYEFSSWSTTSGGGSHAAKCILAGNDLIMPGTAQDIRGILDGLGSRVSAEELKACAERILAVMRRLHVE